jgi:hypothetical protein
MRESKSAVLSGSKATVCLLFVLDTGWDWDKNDGGRSAPVGTAEPSGRQTTKEMP